jgi:hypothetical protein
VKGVTFALLSMADGSVILMPWIACSLIDGGLEEVELRRRLNMRPFYPAC